MTEQSFLFKLGTMVAVFLGASVQAWAASPLDDAVGVWHFADTVNTADTASNLTVHGGVTLGVKLTDDEAAESLRRGGDGLVADFSAGGWLNAGLGTDARLAVTGRTLSCYLRLRSPSGVWDCPIFSRHGGHDQLAYNIFSIQNSLGAEVGTTRNQSVLQTLAPWSEMRDPATAATRWHDVVLRVNGAKLELFVDGRCADEDFMLGDLRTNPLPLIFGGEDDDGSGNVRDGFRGLLDTVAIWRRALDRDEIIQLSGGADRIDTRERTDRGNHESLQYWMPPNRYSVGDCMPFEADGVFHFMYLLDRGHHGAKNGLGAHQWVQATSTDLVHWTHQPFVVEIDQQNEGSICTGSVFYYMGKYYAFYANRSATYLTPQAERPDITGLLCLATSTDGIHFTKNPKSPIITLPNNYGVGTRDPVVFQDPETKQFHMYATTSHRGVGCWAHLSSENLDDWTLQDPIYAYRDGEPECPDWFQWGDRYYTIANHLNGYWRWSNTPTGPWEIPTGSNILMPGIINVPKTAPFGKDRRLICGWTREHGFGGHAIFHELTRRSDGTLGEKFVPEMIPATSDAMVSETNVADGETSWTVPCGDVRVRMRLAFPSEKRDSLRDVTFRYDTERMLRISPRSRSISLGQFRIENVDFSTGSFDVDLIIRDDLIDLCVNSDRTLTDTLPAAAERTFTLSTDADGSWSVSSIEVRPLEPQTRTP